jgi:hypothetical protein
LKGESGSFGVREELGVVEEFFEVDLLRSDDY